MLKKIRKFISIIKRMKKVPGCNSWVGAFVLALDNYRWRKKVLVWMTTCFCGSMI